ncbi:membrane protein [Streptomyces caatingaensis]|uniref:Membrane protein n=1 Tax=Streptomyces caatingaensis TaxID=1678637 RepID=A0A0K9XF20_9ACTN|nr:membrane protein [Streptomyces caatingaensis]
MSATASLAVTHLVPLAGEELDKNKVTPGVLGFIVFAVIGAAVWLLMKSMNKHMKRVDFQEAPEPAAEGADLAAATATATPSDPSAGDPKDKPAKG